MKSVDLTIGLLHSLQRFVDEIEVIESRISSWHGDEGIKANMSAADPEETKKTCLPMIINAQDVGSIVRDLRHMGSDETEGFGARREGMTHSQWVRLLGDHGKAECSPVEYQLRVVLSVLSASRKQAQKIIEDNVDAVAKFRVPERESLSGLLPYDIDFPLVHIVDGFITLETLLAGRVAQKFTDVAVLIHRVEQLVSRVKSIITLPMG
jgi:hypothetical protein